MKSALGVVLGLAMLVPATSFAAQAAPAGTKAPAGLTAAQILAKVSQTYRGLTSFRFVVRHEESGRKLTEPFTGAYGLPGPFGGRPAQYETDLAAVTSGKIRIVVSSPAGEVQLVSDGQITWAYVPNLNEYTEMAAAPLVDEIWNNPIRDITDDLARYRSLAHDSRRAKLRGEATLHLGGQNARCYVVDVPSPAGSRTLWVDEQRLIVLRDQWTSPAGTGYDFEQGGLLDSGVWTSRLTEVDLGRISNDVFEFDVPPGARRVDSFSALHGDTGRAEEVLAGRLLGSVMWNYVQGEEYVLQGSKARDFTLASLGGGNVGLRGLRGKTVVLEFVASWCRPCEDELAAVQKLHAELASQGVVLLGIDDESPESIGAFVKAKGYTFPMLLDPKGTALQLYGVRLVPTRVVINRKGKIAAQYIGAGGEAQLLSALKKAGLKLPAGSHGQSHAD